MAVNSLGSYLDTSSFIHTSAAGAASQTALSDKLKSTSSQTDTNELKEVCREFESYFMEQVYKEMFKSIGSESDGDSHLSSLVDYFKDSAIQTIAAQTTEQTGGPLAQQLYEQMKRNYGIEES